MKISRCFNITTLVFVAVVAAFDSRLNAHEPFLEGVITIHYDSVSKSPFFAGFVSFFIDDQYFIAIPRSSGVTPESRIGIELDSDRQVWVAAMKILGIWEESPAERQKLFRDSSSGYFFLIPMTNESPSNEDEALVWTTIRKNSVDLRIAARNIDIPESAYVYVNRISKDGETSRQIHEVAVREREEFENPYKHLTGVALYHIKFRDADLNLSDDGSAVFREKLSNESDINSSFLGMCFKEPSTAKSTGNHLIILHPLTILTMYEEHLLYSSE